MSRKDFVLIARVVSELEDDAIRQHVAQRFANELARTNGAFDRSRFLTACNVNA